MKYEKQLQNKYFLHILAMHATHQNGFETHSRKLNIHKQKISGCERLTKQELPLKNQKMKRIEERERAPITVG